MKVDPLADTVPNYIDTDWATTLDDPDPVAAGRHRVSPGRRADRHRYRGRHRA